MLKMLIVEDNQQQCKQITNIVSRNVKDVKLYSYVHSVSEALEIINDKSIDFLLLDLKLEDGPGIRIINYLERNNMFEYEKSIIIISGESHMISQIIHSRYVFGIIYKPINFDKLITLVNEFIDTKLENVNINILKRKINIELIKLHYNPSHNGTRYLAEAILQIYLNGEDKANLSRYIYPIIARKYHTTINNIKCDILKATDYSFFECESKLYQSYFNLSNMQKPNTKTIMFTILNKINICK